MLSIGIRSYGSLSALPTQTHLAYQQAKHYCVKKDHNWLAPLHSDYENLLQILLQENISYQKLDRSVLLAILAARKCIQNQVINNDIGINIGSSRGATTLLEKTITQFLETQKCPVQTSPTTTLGNIASWVGHDLQTRGIHFSHSITCSTALHAILNAIAWLRSGMATYFLAGGSESCLTPYTLAQMHALKIYSQLDHDYPCQSMNYTKNSNTMVLGEGAALFLLQNDLDQCNYFISGVGWATEPILHGASISEEASCLQEAMQKALISADLDTVDAIVLHAPGTIQGDLSEYKAIQKTFANKIFPYLTTNKWKIGHTFGAAGALNIELALLMLQYQTVIENPVASIFQQKPKKLQHIMVNAVGFGANAVSIIISKHI